ncbi:MAG TPA: GreA/GreB family elongation factor [Gammaproteobacteria bacterium]|jgi:transcription elongation GreA/GreB family factor|nr:GreA/GreB family elongation factor [Gammaproteobacteria bacterium]
MSRAFVKESDDAGEPLPELSVSPHPNFVTPAGHALIEARVTALEAELKAARAGADKALVARIARDLRYWAQRRASARLVPAATAPVEAVRFGTAVTVRFEDGTQRTFRLVGEDEADPARGLVSWVAPLGKALTGKSVGDEVEALGRAADIVALSP